ncbi:MAG: hypothetical protein H8D45_11450 [Bacteroidetes bacterium]|nr:hypothetical protein [Bacteroidota bacterium]
MDKLTALAYLVNNNPVCNDCARGNLEQIRLAAGLYQLVKDVLSSDNKLYEQQELDTKVLQATTF